MHPRAHLEELLKAGWPAVQRWVDEKATETLTLEFKRSTTVVAKGLSKEDRDAVAKCVSGFANTEGGLLVFGIEARRADNKQDPDVVQSIAHVANLARFADMVSTATRDCVEPKAAGVDVATIEDPAKPGTGVVVVHVPRSFGGPHRVVGGAKDVANHYFMRTAGSTTVIPHRMLAALFNARPEPRLVLQAAWAEPRQVLVALRNDGPGTARNVRVMAGVSDWMGEKIGEVANPAVGSPWLSRAQGVLMLRSGERIFAEEPLHVGVISLGRTRALKDVNGIRLHARVDSETTRPLIIPGEVLRRGELRSFPEDSEDA